MSSQYSDPPAPQAELMPTAHANGLAHRGPYVDQNLTQRNVTNPVVPPNPLAPRPLASLGNIRPVYANDRVAEHNQDATNPLAVKPPHAPTAWRRRRDPYANDGMQGQGFFNNPPIPSTPGLVDAVA